MDVEVEVVFIHEGDDKESEQHKDSHPHVVHIYNDLAAKDVALRAKGTTLIRTLIQKFYERTELQAKEQDKFTCEANGDDALTHVDESLANYLEQGRCHPLVWIFRRETEVIYHFFVDGKGYETTHSGLTGAQIKA